MSVRAWAKWLMSVMRWLAVKAATAIRWLCIVLIAVGLGIAATHYSEGEFLASLALYGALPVAVGLFLADILQRFGMKEEEE
jgi:hypothetical protein